MSALQLGLIVAGVVLVIGVILYNQWQERRLRKTLRSGDASASPDGADAAAARRRVEPTLGDTERPLDSHGLDPAATTPRAPGELPASPFAIPMDDVRTDPDVGRDVAEDRDDTLPVEDIPVRVRTAAADVHAAAHAAGAAGLAPDPDVECVVHVTPRKPVASGALARVLDAASAKPLRWLVRSDPAGAWQPLALDGDATVQELAACLLLADRNGPATEPQIAAFLRLANEVARSVDGAVAAPSAAEEARRAVALDRLCADLDIQIGLTVIKADPATIPGTRLRGVAEAAGFRLAGDGRFEHVHEDTGAVLYTLQNVRNEPFTVESLRVMSAQGVVFLLDVPRVPDPARVFDQMKLAARRMAHTLAGELVDDNRRPLDDVALAKTRAQVQAAADALRRAHIEPGSARAQALFGAG